MVIGSNNGVDSSPVMEFVIDHGRCAGVTLSENEKRQVSIGTLTYMTTCVSRGPLYAKKSIEVLGCSPEPRGKLWDLCLNQIIFRPCLHCPHLWGRSWHSNFEPHKGAFLSNIPCWVCCGHGHSCGDKSPVKVALNGFES